VPYCGIGGNIGGVVVRAHQYVCVLWRLADAERMRLLTAALTQRVPAAHVDGHAPLQVGQAEVDPPVPSECGSQKGEKSLVLVDWQKLPVTQRPALGWEVE
jgi:hypothetical protein